MCVGRCSLRAPRWEQQMIQADQLEHMHMPASIPRQQQTLIRVQRQAGEGRIGGEGGDDRAGVPAPHLDRAAQLLHQPDDRWCAGFDLTMLNEHLDRARREFVRRALKLDFRQYIRAEERATDERSALVECLKMWRE